jgi:hypothetical protein
MNHEAQRWARVLEAHADEHRAMRERGVGRVALFGRPRTLGATVQLPEPFSPYSLHQVNLSPYPGLGRLRGLGELTRAQSLTLAGGVALLGLLGAYYYLR